MTYRYGLSEPDLIIVVIGTLLLRNPALAVIVVIVAVATAAQQQGQTQAYRSRYPHGIAPCTSLLWSGQRITASGRLCCCLKVCSSAGPATARSRTSELLAWNNRFDLGVCNNDRTASERHTAVKG